MSAKTEEMAMKIKLRGNSTLDADKKPFKIKFDSKQSLFGLEKSKDWVLLANYYDTSLLRNTLAYNLSGEMGSTYIVVGRAITGAQDPVAAYNRCVKEFC